MARTNGREWCRVVFTPLTYVTASAEASKAYIVMISHPAL